MICPHCLVSIRPEWNGWSFGQDKIAMNWSFQAARCPNEECDRYFLRVQFETKTDGKLCVLPVYPRVSNRNPLHVSVVDPYRSDYEEASLVLADSPKASAALSRRCLQAILRDHAGVKKADLSKEIQQAIDNHLVPTYLVESLDAIRTVGNFAAHPMKSTNTGEIIDVEPNEAEWLLDTLDGLFDFFFIQPAIVAEKRAQLNAKLQQAGKPPLK